MRDNTPFNDRTDFRLGEIDVAPVIIAPVLSPTNIFNIDNNDVSATILQQYMNTIMINNLETLGLCQCLGVPIEGCPCNQFRGVVGK